VLNLELAPQLEMEMNKKIALYLVENRSKFRPDGTRNNTDPKVRYWLKNDENSSSRLNPRTTTTPTTSAYSVVRNRE
jgi:hypothetical protein